MPMILVPPVTVTQEQAAWIQEYRAEKYIESGNRPSVSDVMRLALVKGLELSDYDGSRRFELRGKIMPAFLAPPENVEQLKALSAKHDVTRSAIVRAGLSKLMGNNNHKKP